MKYAILVADGMSDRPVDDLAGRTPLEVAHTPWMDSMARDGILGRVLTIPTGFPTGSDIANMAILGYNPTSDYTGRGPLEAASMGIKLGPEDVAFRCNLVHLTENNVLTKMKDFTAGHIPTDVARPIIQALDGALGDDKFRFHAGVSYRHLMIWHDGIDHMQTTPPHDIINQNIEPHLPKGKGGQSIRELIRKSQGFFKELSGKAHFPSSTPNPPNSIWPWGQGRAPVLKSLTRRWGVKGAIITAVDLMKGLGIYAGLQVVNVPGATGYYDTDYGAKARYALGALEEGNDLVYVHVEAPDEAGHEGNVREKIRSIESFDREVVGCILEGMQQWSAWSVMALPDHATPLSVRTHTEEPVPFAALSSREERGAGKGFSEREAELSGLYFEIGHELLGRFLHGHWE